MWKKRLLALLVLILAVGVAYFVYSSEPGLSGKPTSKHPFRLGLDLSGGSHLVYRANVNEVAEADVADSMASLRDVIERRINLFGVSETSVQTQKVNVGNIEEQRLIIDLPGITDVAQAVKLIGETPVLEFKILNPKYANNVPTANEVPSDYYISTGLTGRYLKSSTLQFTQGNQSGFGSEAYVGLQFNDEGAKLFEQITKDNVGKVVAIYLDGSPISLPTVQGIISGGQASITGNFTPEEAKELVGRLNSGALPVSVELIGTQTISAPLGQNAINDGIKAGIIGFLTLAILFLLWYRLPGLIAIVALCIYSALIFALFKIIPVTITASGIAGFIISLGIAVDANILIFERMKEEIGKGKSIADAVALGFDRAWSSIRDSNISSLITATVLFGFGTSVIQGFALTFGLGVLVSMISAITVSRIFLRVFVGSNDSKLKLFLFNSGMS